MKDKWYLSRAARLVIATSLTVLAFLTYGLDLDGLFGDTRLADILLVIATAVAGLPIVWQALVSLRYKIVGIDLLVATAMIGATFIGEYWEAAVVAILFTFGHYLEARALNKTRQALKSLIDEAPTTAWIERGDQIIKLHPDEVEIDDVVVVRTGQKVPVDGEVIEGKVYISQASITGESAPVEKTISDEVFAGSVIESGYLRIAAKKVGEATLFANIIELLEEAQDKKAKTQAFLERFAAYYTPAIMVLAIVVYFISRDIYLALTLLVIACPGALVIATPVSIVAGIGNGAKRGILIKGGEAVENTNAARIIAFDKTGTLTEGQPRVVNVETIGVSTRQLLSLAAATERYSEHPLGRAIIDYADSQIDGKLPEPDSTKVLTGRGIVAHLGADTIKVGNRMLLAEHNVKLSASVETSMKSEEELGRTAMLVAQNDKVIGVISVADPIRTGVTELIGRIKSDTGKQVVMLTGDNEATAHAIAKQVGITEVYSQLLPADKVNHIKQLQASSEKVIMVGDGVNDAPALATADVGIAIGGPGKDVAMETADMVLLSGDITKLDYALSLSRATVRNMKANIYFAVSLVVLLLIGVLTKNVIMSFGMLIHVASVLLVIMSASRLLGYNKTSHA
ncbi:MAG: cation-translocating P-type ATPase [Candidatus Saccharimonas sp.]